MNATPVTARQPRAGTMLLLLIVCAAQFMVILDVSIVNVALPSIRAGLHFSTSGLQWVVNAYTLTFAGFLMLGGRCADLLGRRRVFLTGTAVFALCSLLCALAASQGQLVAARALQGFGGAVLSPATLSLITSAFPAGPERNRAVGIWGAMGALGGSSGALLGGILTQAVGWQAIFAVNVPLGALVLLVGARVIPADAPLRRPSRGFDVAGAVLITSSLIAATFGIVRSSSLGWGSAGVLAPLLAGVALFCGFVLTEARYARKPLIPLGVFRSGQLATANGVVTLLYAGQFPVWFFLTLYLQEVLHLSAIQTGLAFLPMTLSIFAGSTVAPRLVGRSGPRPLIATGMAMAAGGILLLTGIAPGGTYLADVLPGAVLCAIGMGLSLVPATIVAMQALPASQSGISSGLLNTSRLMGGALGLAVLSTIADSRMHSAAAPGSAAAQTAGFDLALGVGAALVVVGAVLAALRLRAGRLETQPARTEAPREPLSETPALEREDVLAA